MAEWRYEVCSRVAETGEDFCRLAPQGSEEAKE